MCRTPRQMLKSVTDTLDAMSEYLANDDSDDVDLCLYDTPTFQEMKRALQQQLTAFDGRLKDLLGVNTYELQEIINQAEDELG